MFGQLLYCARNTMKVGTVVLVPREASFPLERKNMLLSPMNFYILERSL